MTGVNVYKNQNETDEAFNLIYLEDVITTNTTIQSMQVDEYFGRVAAYITVMEDYSDWSDALQFSINETNGGEAISLRINDSRHSVSFRHPEPPNTQIQSCFRERYAG